MYVVVMSAPRPNFGQPITIMPGALAKGLLDAGIDKNSLDLVERGRSLDERRSRRREEMTVDIDGLWLEH